jgi:cytochrome c biogenesis protein CcmG, thiol:disulfide interchange protein DsbE
MRLIGWKSFVIAAALMIATGMARASATVGQPAPQLRATELNGQEFDLASELGKVVIVNFWATWCSPCRKEIPALDAFYKRYHNQGLEMIGISADSRHDRSDVEKVAQSLSYPAAMLNDAATNGFGDPEDLPTTWVIGRDGVVRAELTPDKIEVTENSLDQVVLPLLSNKASANKAPSAVSQ